MSEADEAFAKAKRMIAEARETGAERLSFDREENRALERLPEEIGDLSALLTLDLDSTQVSDLSPLAGLTGLVTLSLDKIPVSDIEPLAGLTGLEVLSLEGTQVYDLGPLSDLAGLEILWLNNTPIYDLRPLSGLTRLKVLWLNETLVSDLGSLPGLTRLVRLHLENTYVSDLRPIRELRGLVENPGHSGLTFKGCAAAKRDARIAEIAEIDDNAERAQTLFDYLKDWVPPGEMAERQTEAALGRPILSDALSDIEEEAEQFRSVPLGGDPAKPRDPRHDDLVATLVYLASRLSAAEAQNRLGREVVQSFADYAGHAALDRINPRILWVLANGIRSVFASPELGEALDDFDRQQFTSFLAENDALIGEYYPNARRGPLAETDADPEVLGREVPNALASARDILAEADKAGIFAPSVSNDLEILQRRFDGARKGYLTGATEQERAEAGREMQKTAIQITGQIGRIKGRLLQWQARTGRWAGRQGNHIKENPATTLATVATAGPAVAWVIEKLTPVFNTLWKLLGNMPLPF